MDGTAGKPAITRPPRKGGGWHTPALKLLLAISTLTAASFLPKGDMAAQPKGNATAPTVASWLPSVLVGRALADPVPPAPIPGVAPKNNVDLVADQYKTLENVFNDTTDYASFGKDAVGNSPADVREHDWSQLSLVKELPTQLDQIRAITYWAATAMQYDDGQTTFRIDNVPTAAQAVHSAEIICNGFAALIARTAKEKGTIPTENISLLGLEFRDAKTNDYADGHMVALFKLDGKYVVADGAVMDPKGKPTGLVESLDRYLATIGKQSNQVVVPLFVFSLDGQNKKAFSDTVTLGYVPDLTPLPDFSKTTGDTVKRLKASALEASGTARTGYTPVAADVKFSSRF